MSATSLRLVPFAGTPALKGQAYSKVKAARAFTLPAVPASHLVRH